jgi:uncharacterized membrane protein (DUF4010 family)
MLDELDRFLPREAIKLALVLFLSFLLGLEREGHKARAANYAFGGVRTFPLLGFLGYALARLSGTSVLSLAIGFAVVGAMMVVSYGHKLRANEAAGATTEVSGLLTYLIGALVQADAYWVAVTLGVVAVLLLELREGLLRLTSRIDGDEIAAVAKFLLLSTVILPVLPNRSFTRFDINPFRTWLVVVAVSAVSYASYALQKWLKRRAGALVTAILGGAYSSTVTTIVLARRGSGAGGPRLYAGSTLAASGMMYLRLTVLVSFFSSSLARALSPGFCALAALAIVTGSLLALKVGDKRGTGSSGAPDAKNPLELGPAILFGFLFIATLVLTQLTVRHVGRGGLYGLAAILGLADVDPFVLGLAQSSDHEGATRLFAVAIVIAAAANNVAKAVYARLFGDRETGRLSCALLLGLALAGLAPALWL